jgi:hypothetical protein
MRSAYNLMLLEGFPSLLVDPENRGVALRSSFALAGLRDPADRDGYLYFNRSEFYDMTRAAASDFDQDALETKLETFGLEVMADDLFKLLLDPQMPPRSILFNLEALLEDQDAFEREIGSLVRRMMFSPGFGQQVQSICKIYPKFRDLVVEIVKGFQIDKEKLPHEKIFVSPLGIKDGVSLSTTFDFGPFVGDFDQESCAPLSLELPPSSKAAIGWHILELSVFHLTFGHTQHI